MAPCQGATMAPLGQAALGNIPRPLQTLRTNPPPAQDLVLPQGVPHTQGQKQTSTPHTKVVMVARMMVTIVTEVLVVTMVKTHTSWMGCALKMSLYDLYLNVLVFINQLSLDIFSIT